MGVLMGRSLQDMGLAESGVEAENIFSEGKVLVTGVASWANLGLLTGMMA